MARFIKTYKKILLLLPVFLLLATPYIAFAAEKPGWIESKIAQVIGYISGAFVSLVAFFMLMAARMFELLIDFTIVNFSANFATLVSDGVNTAWILFRDITNIILIGVFVYIAFNVMLNTAVVNVEKLVVRVLVMAVLINFSLFASKVIIDISNITAIQFYEQIRQVSEEQGLAGAILQRSGIGATFKTNELLSASSATTDVANVGKKHGIVALLVYTMYVSFFVAGLLAIFVYGSILLISRALMLIFLMITSPLAFAAWMVPGLEGHWKKWWSVMLRNAFFAPFLMLFLWATMRIMEGLTDANGSIISTLLANPEAGLQDTMLRGLFHSILVLGLLYASIKIANSFALMGTELAEKASIRSLGFGLKWSGIGAAGQVTAATAALATRNTVGRFAGTVQKWNRGLANTKLGFLASARLDQALEGIKKKGFRVGDSEQAQKFAALAGVKLAPTLPQEKRVAFEKGVIEHKRTKRAEKEEKAAEKTLKKPSRDTEKYRRMQQDHLQLYKNALEKEVQASQRKIAEAGRVVNSLDNAIADAHRRGDTKTAQQLEKERDQAQETIAKETEKISQVRDQINKFSQAQADAAQGKMVDLETLYKDAAAILPETSAAKRELDAIHSLREQVQKDLMARQYFDPDAYQVSPTPNLIARTFDPQAAAIRKEAVKSADYPDHYKKVGGQFKDEAVATSEIVNRAIKTFAQKGTQYHKPSQQSGSQQGQGGGQTP